MVCLRAGMVMVPIMRLLPMQEPGRHAERRQQHEHTVSGAQTQRAQPVPVSVSEALVSQHSATKSIQRWQSMTHQGNRSSRASSTDGLLLANIASCMQQRKEFYCCEEC
jgi:hypothetical protein